MRIGNLEVTDLRGQLPATGEYPTRALADIRRIVIHHTAGDIRDFTAREIAEYQITADATRGNGTLFPAIAYHFVVHWAGSIEYTQDITRATWHAHAANADSIAIVLPGDWTQVQPPPAQLAATRELVANLQYALGQWYPVEGHTDVVTDPAYATSCPGSSWPAWRETVTVRQPVPDPRDARIKDLEAEVASLRGKVVQAVTILGSVV